MYTRTHETPTTDHLAGVSTATQQAESAAREREDRTGQAHDPRRTADDGIKPLRFLLQTKPVFPEALSQIVGRLAQAQKNHLLHSYTLIGGFAVSAWGVARAT